MWYNGTIYWAPTSTAATINFTSTTVTGWNSSNITPASANKIDSTEAGHVSLGNWYNWTAAIASNDSSNLTTQYQNAPNSICPSGWMLSSSFAELMSIYRIRQSGLNYQENGFDNIRKAPLYFVRAGSIANGNNRITGNKSAGDYWLSIISTGYDYYGVHMYFESNRINVDNQNSWLNGFSLRCLAR